MKQPNTQKKGKNKLMKKRKNNFKQGKKLSLPLLDKNTSKPCFLSVLLESEGSDELLSVSIPLQPLLGSPSIALFPFLNMLVSLLKAKFFPRLKALRCISASSWGHSKESLSLLYKSFLRPLLTYALPRWFPLLNITNITELERLNQAASRAITGCLSSSSIPLLFSEVCLPLFKSP